MANSPAIRTGNLSAVAEFVFRPGGVAEGNVFTQWAMCHATASSYGGISVIRVDSSLARASVSAGIWDMSGVSLSGFEHVEASGPSDVLEFSDGAELQGLERVDGPLVLRNVGSTPAIYVSSFTSLVLDTGVIVEASGAAPLVSVEDGASLYLTMLGGCQLRNVGTAPVSAEGPSGTLVFQLFSGSQVALNTVSGDPSQVSVSLFSSAANFELNQVGLTVSPSITRIAAAARVGYDNVSSGLASTDVQGAIDELAPGGLTGLGTLGQRTYGNVFVVWAGALAPLTVNDLVNTYGIKRGNLDLLTSTPSYAGCRWRMEYLNTTPPTVIDNLTFSTAQEIVDWVNANVPQAAGRFTPDVQVAAYDVIDPSIDPLFKIMGKNRTFSRFRAFDKYWSPSTQTVDNEFAVFLDGLWTSVWGAPVPTGNPPASWGDEFRLFWVPSNHRRLYLLPNTGFQMDLTSSAGNRQMIQISDDTLQPATTSSWSTDPSRNPRYGVMDPSGTSFEYYSLSDGFKQLPNSLLNGNSVVIGYPMVDGSGNRSVYVKPVGVDIFHTNWFDDSRYQLEAVGALDRDGQNRVRVLSPETTPQPRLNSGGLYALSDFLVPLAFPNSSTHRGGSYRPGDVRFQLRDLTTNRVSPFSNAKIGWDFKKRFRPLAALVRNDATR